MHSNNKCYKNFQNSNYGAAGIIVAILMLGLFFVMYAVVQGVYVPQWMKEKESEHMELVANQFSNIKSSIDALTLNVQPYHPLTNSLTLGSKEMPFLSSNRGYGDVIIQSQESKIILENSLLSKTFTVGNIKYSSKNSYFIDQSYIYENGAVILNQTKGAIIFIKPTFLVTEDDDIVINLIQIVDKGVINSLSGYGTCSIQTSYVEHEKEENINFIEKITVISPNYEAWKKYFETTLTELDVNNFDYDVVYTENSNEIKVQFNEDKDLGINFPLCHIDLYKVDVEINQGWT